MMVNADEPHRLLLGRPLQRIDKRRLAPQPVPVVEVKTDDEVGIGNLRLSFLFLRLIVEDVAPTGQITETVGQVRIRHDDRSLHLRVAAPQIMLGGRKRLHDCVL